DIMHVLCIESPAVLKNYQSCPTRRSSDLAHSPRWNPPARFRPRISGKRQYEAPAIDCPMIQTGAPMWHQGPSLRTAARDMNQMRSEEHTSELQSREKLVCRLLLEKKKSRE